MNGDLMPLMPYPVPGDRVQVKMVSPAMRPAFPPQDIRDSVVYGQEEWVWGKVVDVGPTYVTIEIKSAETQFPLDAKGKVWR